MNSKLVIGTLALIILVAAGGYFLATSSQKKETVTETKTATPTSAPRAAGEREFTVEGSEFSFSPASITVAAGEAVSITFKNIGKTRHNFTIEELGIKTKLLSPGGEETVSFVAEDSGTYTFFCSVPGHRQSGMEGTLTAN